MGERLDKGGLAAALAIVGAGGGLVDENGNQADLFGAEDVPLPLPTKGRSGPKGGRPVGALNRTTEQTVAWFMSQHRSPLAILGQIAGYDLRELHDLLQEQANKHTRHRDTAKGLEQVRVLVDPLAVLKLQRDAAAAVLPYVHKQLPKAIEIETAKRGMVILGNLDVLEDAQSDDLGLLPVEIEENQQVAETARAQSHGKSSRTVEKASERNPLAFTDD